MKVEGDGKAGRVDCIAGKGDEGEPSAWQARSWTIVVSTRAFQRPTHVPRSCECAPRACVGDGSGITSPSTVSVTAALMRSLRALALRAHLYVFVCPKLGRSSMLHAAWRAPVNRIKVDRLAEPLGCGADGGRHACNLREEVRHVRALRSHPVLDLVQEAEAVGCGLDVQDEGAHVAWVQVAQVGKLWGTNARRMHHDCGRSERCNFAP